ncbi:MAG: helicase-related protein [Candidatus Puniceispirillales bacterium]
MPPSSSLPLPRAVLGPTNTGKTFYAMERMLGHPSGMMGFPLRLLARENYERAVEKVGKAKVALITGEEKIIPPAARYFLCTVEAMPLDRRVDFLAVDEVQLAADPERGHVFTDRILNARGLEETLLLGAETIRRVLQAMIPGISIETRERFSRLSWSGQKKVTRLPQRSAVVAYSIPEVIRLAELIRAQRGGTAIVMGALSPRARNAQVELYQSGDVDYMVATDAIGMGLNMDINHVALAGDIKFDGRRPRRLTPAELAQVAGRAGRHTRDGTFGITETCEIFEDDVIEAIENHRFPFLSGVFYRNSSLDYSSPDALVKSMEARPPLALMTRKLDADDQQALVNMIERDDVRVRAHGETQVRLLHDVCQIPDYQREYSDSHIQLLARIYGHLVVGERLPKDWVAASMQRLDRPDGDMDTLMNRLSAIRTWSYISQRQGWLDDAETFQGLARTIEDRVSDSLNQVLTQRFVDRRAAVLSKRLKENSVLMSVIKNDGTVLVEGEEVGHLDGFVFTPQISESDEKGPVLAAARKALGDEISQRARAIVASADEAFKPDQNGMIHWREAVIGRLVKGDHLYQPRAEVRASDLLEGDTLKSVQDRLNAFAASWPKTVLEKAVALTGDGLTGAARGIAYQVYENLGTLPTRAVITLVRELDEDGKRQLAQHGVRLGVDMIYMADLLKPAQITAKALLYSLDTGEAPEHGPPPAGRVAIDHVEGVSDAYWLATGYRRLGSLVMRVDMAERLSAVVRAAAREGQFMISEEMLSLAGATREQMDAILIDLGYLKVDEKPAEDAEKPPLVIYARPEKQRRKPARRQADGQSGEEQRESSRRSSRPKKQAGGKSRPPRSAPPREPRINPDSPFAVLAQLKAGASSDNG